MRFALLRAVFPRHASASGSEDHRRKMGVCGIAAEAAVHGRRERTHTAPFVAKEGRMGCA